MYIFKEGTRQFVDDAILSHDDDGHIGDFESGPDYFAFNFASGQDTVEFSIDQVDGKVKAKFTLPNNDKNMWSGPFAENLLPILQDCVIKQNGGKKTRKRTYKKRRVSKRK
jgi:hypothetical protein